MILRLLIADDELLARERLRRLLKDEPNVEIVGECVNGEEALEAIRALSPDVILMDVCMPELDAFGVIRGMKARPDQAVILVTAHDQFAVKAFEAQTVDYLLKPFDRDRLSEALRRARTRIEKAHRSSSVGAVLDRLKAVRPQPPRNDRLTVKSNGRLLPLRIADIQWIQSANNYCELHVGTAEHLIRQSLASLESGLSRDHFIRISRSLIVNVDCVQELRLKSHGDLIVVLRGGTQLTASRNYRTLILSRLGMSGE